MVVVVKKYGINKVFIYKIFIIEEIALKGSFLKLKNQKDETNKFFHYALHKRLFN